MAYGPPSRWRVGMTVLIVEDELPAQRRLVRLLRAHPAYSDAPILCADDVTEARRVLAADAVQLVLLDLDLHGDDGFRLLSATTDAEMRVVVVSAHADRALQAFEVGVLDFVAKPVNAAGLLLALGRAQPAFRIRRAVPRRRASPSFLHPAHHGTARVGHDGLRATHELRVVGESFVAPSHGRRPSNRRDVPDRTERGDRAREKRVDGRKAAKQTAGGPEGHGRINVPQTRR